MGVVAGRMRARARQVADVPRTGVDTAARTVVAIAEREGARVAPRGVGNRGARRRLAARAEVRPGQARVRGTPAGGWVWVTTGTRPHRIGDARRWLYGPGWAHPVLGPVPHPGSRGRGAWGDVETRAVAEVPELFRTLVDEAVAGG
jgi:hypothetical protein